MERDLDPARQSLAAQYNLFVDKVDARVFYVGSTTNQKHSPGHRDCPPCNELRTMFLSALSPELPFTEAAALYMRMRQIDATPGAVRSARYIKPNTIKGYEEHIRSLTLFFGAMPLKSIDLGNLRGYQWARLQGAEPFIRYRRPHDARPGGIGKQPCPVKAEKVKQELGLLIRILKRANAWTMEMEEFFEHAQGEEREVARALTPEEQFLWLEIARTKERWQIVFWWSIVAFDTCCSTNELRALRIGDVNLHHQTVNIPWEGSKNKHRHRCIPIENADCLHAFENLLLRAQDLGASSPLHYLFPFRPRGSRQYDPARPMTVTAMKARWDEVRQASGLPWFRQYDARHTGCTRLAEQGVPAHIIAERMGHADDRMQLHYRHISESAQRGWLRDPHRQAQFKLQPDWFPPAAPTPPPKPPKPPVRVVNICGQRIVLNA